MSKKNIIHPMTMCTGYDEKPGFAVPFTYVIPPPKDLMGALTSFYIEGPKQKIIVDASASGDFMFHDQGYVSFHEVDSPESGLAKYGLKPSDIDIVICTHLHADHMANASKYADARFIVQKKELDEARNPHPITLGPRVYALQQELDKKLKWEVVDGDVEIAEGIKVMLTPGHTTGGQSVVIDTEAGPAIITGFCCIPQQFSPTQPVKDLIGWEVVPGYVHTDARAYYDSMLKVKKMAKILITTHGTECIGVESIPAKPKSSMGRPAC